jgi:hypothetical protein
MKPRHTIAAATGLIVVWTAVPAAPNAGPCRHKEAGNCFKLPATLDFSSVPNVSSEVVGAEPKQQAPELPAAGDDPQPASQPYTGPMLGVDSRVRGPTVGYYWSIH